MSTSAAPAVLNVDDFEPGRYARTRLLKQAGYTVFETGLGLEALDLVRRERPSLVLLDVHLPDISGLEICRQIKQDPDLASTMVLQISASAIAPSDWVDALDIGADTYLVEPVAPAVLLATIRALLRIADTEKALQRANSELRRSNEDLAAFAAMASHDLQEPLRTINSMTQLMVRRFGGQLGAEGEQFMSFISASSARMGELIKDLLRYAEVGARKKFEAVDLNAVLEKTKDHLDTAIRESGAQITASPLPVVHGEQFELFHLFLNVVANAIKYRGDRSPVITIFSQRHANRWLVKVEDNGIGFPAEFSEQIFEAFKRLGGQDSSGTGIGLAIARKVVENHGGAIWAESKVGEGSTFFFTLPDHQTTVSPLSVAVTNTELIG